MMRLGTARRRVAGAPSVRRLVRTVGRYRDRDGNHHAAALTFFTLLALVPLLMLAVAVTGFVLAADGVVLAQLDAALAVALPVGASGAVGGVVHTVVAERGRLGVLALAVALFSGWSWIAHVRDSVTAMLGQPRPRERLWRTVLSDVVTLFGIGVAMVLSFASAALSGRIGTWVLEALGLGGTLGARVLLTAGSIVVGLLANWVVVGWCLAKLPRVRRPVREVLLPAAVGALGLAALQQLGGLYLALLTHSPAVATLGALVGLLLFVYTLMRWLLLVTVWSATSASDPETTTAEGLRRAGGTLAVGASAGLVGKVLRM
ncbi:YihY/virulence factor BrkB family protein [Actinomycetospora sp. CA-084318]|uniref:YihY/virulence factor BrkB family protein n=1 Tax=Actinomycetospora sp. CA-084318 TaxID=3239892 RepID=UPI003D992334